MALQGACIMWVEVRAMQTGLEATVYSAGNATTTADLGEDRCRSCSGSNAPPPPLSSFGLAAEEAPGLGETNWPAELRRRVIWPPGSLYSDALSPSKCDAERLTAAVPDDRRRPYGAPSVLRRVQSRGSAFKGPEARYRL